MPEINVKKIVNDWKKDLKLRVKPNMSLLVIQIGDDEASNAYIKGKRKDCEELGVKFFHQKYNDFVLEDEVYEKIAYAGSPFILQLPVPKHIDLEVVKRISSARFDVDGFSHQSLHEPCTPKGIIHLLDEIKFQYQGKNAVILGRSDIVGKPVSSMLLDKDMTISICHSKTPYADLVRLCKNADLIIGATGVPKIINKFLVSDIKQQIIIDVGINRINGKLHGDIDPFIYQFPNISYTPVPGGVGLLTRAQLMENVISAYENLNKI